jgi:hypothetical protein
MTDDSLPRRNNVAFAGEDGLDALRCLAEVSEPTLNTAGIGQRYHQTIATEERRGKK